MTRTRTFRPRAGERWIYVVLHCIAVTLFYLGVLLLPRNPLDQDFFTSEMLVGLGVILLLLAVPSWRTWTSRVIVDDVGVRWKGGGNDPGNLQWESVQGLDYDRQSRIVIIGLTEKVTSRFRPLPFVTKELYLALKERTGGLPLDVEKLCLVR